MPAVRSQARLTEVLIRPVAFGMFGFYLFWNAVWIASGRLPPSMLRALAGVPCPTTGCTRSMIALFHGQWAEAFCWNPFTLTYVGLLACSAFLLVRQILRGERLMLRPLVGWLWMASLLAGWGAKFLIGPRYW